MSTTFNNGASRLLKRQRIEYPDAPTDPSPGVRYGSDPLGGAKSSREVILRSAWEDDSILTGSNRPPLFCTERLQSTNLVVNSNHRVTGDPFRFTVNCGGSLQRGRMLSLYRAIIPKIPNITALNNVLRMTLYAGTGSPIAATITFPAPAFYTTADFANELVSQLNGWASPDTFICTFDPRTETFTLTSVGGHNFTIDPTSSFHIRGANFFQFSNLSGLVSTRTSTKAGMLYTRYVTITSSRLDRYGVAPTLLSAEDVPAADIVAVVDTTKLYTPEDFDLTRPFAGCFAEINTPEAPFIRIANDAREFNTTGIDFLCHDEYGTDLQTVFGTDNTQGIVLFFEIYF